MMKQSILFLFLLSIVSCKSTHETHRDQLSNKITLLSLRTQFENKLRIRAKEFAKAHFKDCSTLLIDNNVTFFLNVTTKPLDPNLKEYTSNSALENGLKLQYKSLAREVYLNIYYDCGDINFQQTHFIIFNISGPGYGANYHFSLEEFAVLTPSNFLEIGNKIKNFNNTISEDIRVQNDGDDLNIIYRVSELILMNKNIERSIVANLGRKAVNFIFEERKYDYIFLESHYISFKFILDGKDLPYRQYDCPLTDFQIEYLTQSNEL